MQHTREEIRENLAERWCWPMAQGDDARVMRLNAHQVGHRVCQRVTAKRQGPRMAGPTRPEALASKIPLAVSVVKIQAHEGLYPRALVTQAPTRLAGSARPHTVVFDRGFLGGRWVVAAPPRQHLRGPGQRGQGGAGPRRVHPAHVRAGDGLPVGDDRTEVSCLGNQHVLLPIRGLAQTGLNIGLR